MSLVGIYYGVNSSCAARPPPLYLVNNSTSSKGKIMQDWSEILIDVIRHTTATISESADESAFQASLTFVLLQVMRKS